MNKSVCLVSIALALSGCFGSGEIKETCDEPEPYQTERQGKRIEVPEDLDPLDTFKEMPVPEAETPPRPAGARCITAPPSIRTE